MTCKCGREMRVVDICTEVCGIVDDEICDACGVALMPNSYGYKCDHCNWLVYDSKEEVTYGGQ